MRDESQHVVDALYKIVGQPEHDENQIARYFSPAYQRLSMANHWITAASLSTWRC